MRARDGMRRRTPRGQANAFGEDNMRQHVSAAGGARPEAIFLVFIYFFVFLFAGHRIASISAGARCRFRDRRVSYDFRIIRVHLPVRVPTSFFFHNYFLCRNERF